MTTGIELGASSCVLVGTTSSSSVRPASTSIVTGAQTFDARDRRALAAALLAARRDGGFNPRARVVAWGPPGSHIALDRDHVPDVSAIVDAGFEVETIVSVPQALALVLDMHRVDSRRAAVAAVAVNADGAAIAIVHRGQTVAARTFAWTLGVPFGGGRSEQLERYLLISQLAPQLRHLIEFARPVYNLSVGSIVLCGSLPELRSLAMLLIEEMDLEVETLDSPELVSSSAVPPIDQVASLQLAAGAAAFDASAPAFAGGDAESKSADEGQAVVASSSLRHIAGSAAFVLFVAWASMQVAGTAPASPAFPEGLAVSAANAAAPPSPALPAAPASAAASQPTPTPAPARQPAAAITAPQPEATMGRLDPVPAAAPRPRASRPSAIDDPQVPPAPLPRVDGIAISGDRRLAIIDGEIVAPGDRVGLRTVRRIESNGVVLREPDGRDVFVAIRTRKPPPGGP